MEPGYIKPVVVTVAMLSPSSSVYRRGNPSLASPSGMGVPICALFTRYPWDIIRKNFLRKKEKREGALGGCITNQIWLNIPSRIVITKHPS
jgi:hypothetical protein